MYLVNVKVSRDNWYYLEIDLLVLQEVSSPHAAVCTFRDCLTVVLVTMSAKSHRWLLLSPEGIPILSKMNFLPEADVWDMLLIDSVVLHLRVSCLWWKRTLPTALAPYACRFSYHPPTNLTLSFPYAYPNIKPVFARIKIRGMSIRHCYNC